MRSSVSPYVTTPQPSIAVGSRVRLDLGGACDLLEHRLLARVRSEAIALGRPAALTAEEQHRRVLAGAVVLEPRRLRPALEVVLRRARLRQETLDRRELIRAMQMRGARDRDLGVVEVGSRADDRQRLDRLRGASEERHERGVSPRSDDLTICSRDGVDAVSRLDDLTPALLHHDRVHAHQPTDARFEPPTSGYRRTVVQLRRGYSCPNSRTGPVALLIALAAALCSDRAAGGRVVGSTRLREPHEHTYQQLLTA